MLSRVYISSHNDSRSEIEKDSKVIHLSNHLAISELQLRKIQQVTSEDETLKDVIKIIVEGWHAKNNDLHLKLHPYFHIRDELATQDGIVFTGP